MKNVIITLGVLIALPVFGARTTVADNSLRTATGKTVNGVIILTPSQRWQAVDGFIVTTSAITVTVNSSVFSVSLEPNDAGTPNPTYYTANYQLTGEPRSADVWFVPTSGSPVTLATVERFVAPTPTPIGYITNLNGLTNPVQVFARTNDTNVTLAISSVPSTHTFTLGWQGTLAVARGGTGTAAPSLVGGTGVTISGSWPNQTVTATGSGGISQLTGDVTAGPGSGSQAATVVATHLASALPVAQGGSGTGTAFTSCSVVFAGAAGVYSQDNANLCYDSSNKRLGIGTSSPGVILHVFTPAGTASEVIDAHDGSSQSNLTFEIAGAQKMQIGTQPDGTGFIYDVTHSRDVFDLITSGQVDLMPLGGNLAIGGVAPTNYRVDLQSSGSAGTARVYDQTTSTGQTYVQIRGGAGQGGVDLTDWFTNASVLVAAVDELGISTFSSGVKKIEIANAFGLLSSDSCWNWKSSVNVGAGSADLGLCRNAAGILEINNSSPGTYRDLILRNITINGTCTGSGCGGGSGTVTVVGSGTLTSTACVTGGGTQTLQTPSANCTVDSSGNVSVNTLTTTASGAGSVTLTEGAAPSGSASKDTLYGDSTAHRLKMNNNNGGGDTVVGAITTDILTNKTYDTAGTGNVFKINGTPISAVIGSGAVCLASGCGAANGRYLTIAGTDYIPAIMQASTKPPTLSILNTVGSSTCTLNADGSYTLKSAATSGDNLVACGSSIGANTSLTSCFMVDLGNSQGNTARFGLFFRESSSSKMESLEFTLTGSTSTWGTAVNRWTNQTTYAGSALETFNPTGIRGSLACGKLTLSGGNVSFQFSSDGRNFSEAVTEAQTVAFTSGPNQWGIFASPNNTVNSAYTTAEHYLVQ